MKPILTGKTLHTLNILLAAAPAGQWETERLERRQRGLSKISKPHYTHPAAMRTWLRKRLPNLVTALFQISGQLPEYGQHGERHIFLHHPCKTWLGHADNANVRRDICFKKLLYTRPT